MGRRGYSRDFKAALITKILNRGDQTIEEICAEEGVVLSSAGRWVRSYARVPGMKNSNSCKPWTPEDKLRVLFQSHGLKEEDLGAFLRQEGLHSQQISEWRAEVLTALGSRKSSVVKDDRDRKIRELEQNLDRKDKALAEASALLILQKKVNLLWGNKGEDEK